MLEQPRFERKTQNRVIAPFTDRARPDCRGYGDPDACREREKTLAFKPAMMQELPTGRTRLVSSGSATTTEMKP